MYISKIQIKNYRMFKNFNVELAPRITVLIGENNSGKTSLLNAISLVLQRNIRNRPELEDFHQGITPSIIPPEIVISITLRSSETDTADDCAVVATWITKPTNPWEASLTYRFSLPDPYHQEFANLNPVESEENFLSAVRKLLPKYVSRIYGGAYSTQFKAEPEMLSRIDFSVLEALRDAQSKMFSGTNPLLKKMLHAVLDTKEAPEDEKENALENTVQLQNEFKAKSSELAENVKSRLDTDKLFKLVEETGASDGGFPSLSGTITENDLISSLRLVIETVNGNIPISHHGLGYNNLIYISLILSSLELEDKKYSGDNALVFPVLAIEEPEAHLHPSMQYKLLKYLNRRMQDQKSSKQLILTTHSTHITAATELDSIVCLSITNDGSSSVSYPGRLFPETAEGEKSKKYVERYLDATKSSMLFAKGVLLVEGISEQLVLPSIAEMMGSSFEDYHVSILPVGGLTFKHFLPLFGGHSREGQSVLDRRVACIIDADPARKDRTAEKPRWKKCFPCQLNVNAERYEYRALSPNVTALQDIRNVTDNIKVFFATKTFEYDLALKNCTTPILILDSCSKSDCLRRMVEEDTPDFEEFSNFCKEELVENIKAHSEENSVIKQIGFACCLLNSVKGKKGEYSLELSRILRDLCVESVIDIPEHIEEAILWVCSKNEGA